MTTGWRLRATCPHGPTAIGRRSGTVALLLYELLRREEWMAANPPEFDSIREELFGAVESAPTAPLVKEVPVWRFR